MSAGIGSGDGRTGERHANDRRKWFPDRSWNSWTPDERLSQKGSKSGFLADPMIQTPNKRLPQKMKQKQFEKKGWSLTKVFLFVFYKGVK